MAGAGLPKRRARAHGRRFGLSNLKRSAPFRVREVKGPGVAAPPLNPWRRRAGARPARGRWVRSPPHSLPCAARFRWPARGPARGRWRAGRARPPRAPERRGRDRRARAALRIGARGPRRPGLCQRSGVTAAPPRALPARRGRRRRGRHGQSTRRSRVGPTPGGSGLPASSTT